MSDWDFAVQARSSGVVRVVVVILTLLLTGVGTCAAAWELQAVNGLSVFDFLTLVLFAILFAWIIFSFCLATLGFAKCLFSQPVRRSEIPQSLNAPRSRTVVLMPVYNESPQRVFAGIEAMIASLREHQSLDAFEFFILSDSTHAEVWLQEELAWSKVIERNEDACVHYRHRPENAARKAGNIADFCTRWGSTYAYMVVLDADSLMEGATLIEMVRRMDASERLGILQVPPVPLGRRSLFARLQQFSAAVYGSIFVEGFSMWAGHEGNYWGHNAILRVQPFMAHCELPVLPGQAPLGGEILSHDFVEAALMVRAGYRVTIASDLGGSYEECPTTLTDYAQRDHRWCQGNLQHSKLLLSEGFRPMSRSHFASGIMAYLASPLWILLMLSGVAGAVWDSHQWSEVSRRTGLTLFAVVMMALLVPKLFSLILICRDDQRLRKHGGWLKLWASGSVEMVASVILSPIMAVFHSRAVITTLLGFDAKWSAQQRDERGVRLAEATKDFGLMTIMGMVGTSLLMVLAPSWLWWFSPVLLGLVFSIGIAVVMGSQRVGESLAKFGLLSTPLENTPPQVVKHFEQHRVQLKKDLDCPGTMLDFVIRDPKMFKLHHDIQSQTTSARPMSTNQSKAIEAAWSSGGTEKIPEKVHCDLLNDLTTLRMIHIAAQTQCATSSPNQSIP